MHWTQDINHALSSKCIEFNILIHGPKEYRKAVLINFHNKINIIFDYLNNK